MSSPITGHGAWRDIAKSGRADRYVVDKQGNIKRAKRGGLINYSKTNKIAIRSFRNALRDRYEADEDEGTYKGIAHLAARQLDWLEKRGRRLSSNSVTAVQDKAFALKQGVDRGIARALDDGWEMEDFNFEDFKKWAAEHEGLDLDQQMAEHFDLNGADGRGDFRERLYTVLNDTESAVTKYIKAKGTNPADLDKRPPAPGSDAYIDLVDREIDPDGYRERKLQDATTLLARWKAFSDREDHPRDDNSRRLGLGNDRIEHYNANLQSLRAIRQEMDQLLDHEVVKSSPAAERLRAAREELDLLASSYDKEDARRQLRAEIKDLLRDGGQRPESLKLLPDAVLKNERHKSDDLLGRLHDMEYAKRLQQNWRSQLEAYRKLLDAELEERRTP